MVDINIGLIPTVQNQKQQGGHQRGSQPAKGRKDRVKDRRQNKVDRRQGVRDGFVVSLSIQNDRRKGPDRRKS